MMTRSLAVALVALFAVAHSKKSDNVYEKNLVNEKLQYSSIIRNHANPAEKEKSNKNFPHGDTLGYVTPWNNHGYDLAKWYPAKFTYISPTWFNIRPNLEITGEHDIDAGWVKEVRGSKKTGPKVVPRFQLEGWSQQSLAGLLTDQGKVNKLVSRMAGLVKKNNFQGLVLDAGGLGAAGSYREQLMYFLRSLANELHDRQQELIYVIPPYNKDQNGYENFGPNDYEEFSVFVDRFSLMTYDYSSHQTPGPNAPLSWVKSCVNSIIPSHMDAHQLLVGINWYGYDYNVPQGRDAIRNDQYLQLLKLRRPTIKWESGPKEHVFEYSVGTERHKVYYPTLKSIFDRLLAIQELGAGVSIWELGQGLDYWLDMF